MQLHQRHYLEFCDCLGFQSLPAAQRTLCLFAQYLARDIKSPDSICNYINSIKWLHILEGLEVTQFDHPSLKLTFKGLARSLKHLPNQALPITPEILTEIKGTLDMQCSEDVTFWTILIFGFFLMARKSNLVPDSVVKFDPCKQLTRGHVSCTPNVLLVTLNWSKTNQLGSRQHTVPLLTIPRSPLCPVAAYTAMINMVPGSNDDPLFRTLKKAKWVPVTYRQLNKRLKSALNAVGRVSSAYSTHSLRRGGATFANMAGVPRSYIKAVGDWRSDAVDLYTANPMEARIAAAQMIRNDLSENR